ncbi:MAG: hypothetical protein EZS28_046562, partial [Streblomastix strix]
ETDFVEKIIAHLNTVQLKNLKYWHFQILYNVCEYITDEQKGKLFDKGVIQTMVKMLDCKDEEVRMKASQIISDIVIAAGEQVKEGVKHPYLKELGDIGAVSKLIELLKDKECENKNKVKLIMCCGIVKVGDTNLNSNIAKINDY